MIAKLHLQQPLLQSSVSHDPSFISYLVFVETDIFFQDYFMAKKFKKWKIEYFCKIINAFVPLDQFNPSSQNKSINLF